MSKKTLILGIALVVLIISAYAYHGPLKKWQNNLGKPKNILTKIKIDLVDKIEIKNYGKILILAKQNQKWKYDNSKNFYVDDLIMSKVFDELKLAALSDIELVSNNKERKNEFKTDGSGLEVKIYQTDKQVFNFFIGSMASDYVSSYISMPESAATYAVKADLPAVFDQAEWRDLTIFSSDKTKINKIRFQYPNREFTAELKDGKWSGTLPDKFAVKTEKIQPVLDIMSNLKAMEIPAQTFTNTGLDKHLIIIQATGDGVNNVLMVGAANNDLYYAKTGDSDNIYLISKVERDKLDKSSWQLK
ncbi:DUF4340 domain-containing protein [Patescibacteria group bacterium]|nr:DUF4340 domain-containing protein [Patescibacteria group bacterium]MBU1663098.1 DUF4340 domain-containing protein [Patescibacteria group bacterium]MBU1934049.1 DUF4340 domain-containing protein [Patescibacteria group bacterium]MBU2008031.1 DUF4340 domain-containing protein [Patescibacteria group bacterium]MBU2233667.1 DUF4340 domain-containing protein [Patescibacteria group bacterium]